MLTCSLKFVKRLRQSASPNQPDPRELGTRSELDAGIQKVVGETGVVARGADDEAGHGRFRGRWG